MKESKILETYRSQRKAEEKFKSLIMGNGYKPDRANDQSANQVNETLDQFLNDKLFFIQRAQSIEIEVLGTDDLVRI